MVDVLLGLQWGDEGKGKIVDYLAPNYQVVARFQGGPNAGHTLVMNGHKHVLHTVPSGIFRAGILNLIGNGVVIDPITLKMELEKLLQAGVPVKERLLISRKAHLILPSHRLLDAVMEASKGDSKIGSTLKGIGPTYTDKTSRQGLRIGDVFLADFAERYARLKERHLQMASHYPTHPSFDLAAEEAKWLAALEFLKEFNFVNGEYFIAEALQKGQRILAEGAQGSMLDIDFGTYPFVTSSNTITAGVCSGLGIAPKHIGEVIGITKAYCTRVGGGPFPTELLDEVGEQLRKAGNEFGSTTGRPRRCGWIDLPQLKYTVMLNGVTELVITKADVLNHFTEFKAATDYEYNGQLTRELPYDMNLELPKPIYKTYPGWMQDLDEVEGFEHFPTSLSAFVKDLQDYLEVPVTMVSVGADRDQLIVKNDSLLVDSLVGGIE
jgi:adenylosuccinate synthase